MAFLAWVSTGEPESPTTASFAGGTVTVAPVPVIELAHRE